MVFLFSPQGVLVASTQSPGAITPFVGSALKEQERKGGREWGSSTIRVCAFVCMCMCVPLHAVSVHMCLYVYTCVCVHLCECIYTCACGFVCALMCVGCLYMHVCVCMYLCVHTGTCVCCFSTQFFILIINSSYSKIILRTWIPILTTKIFNLNKTYLFIHKTIENIYIYIYI